MPILKFALSPILVIIAAHSASASRVATTDVCRIEDKASLGCSQLQRVAHASIQPVRDPAALFATTTVSKDNSSRTVELEGNVASVAGTQLLKAYARLMLALHSMNKRTGPSTAELKRTIAHLMDDQTSFPKACGPRVKTAAANLKKLQRDIRATVGDLRHSKKVVSVSDSELKSTLETIKVLDEKKAESLEVCDQKTATDRAVLQKLQKDLQTMRAMREKKKHTSTALLELVHLSQANATDLPAVSGVTHGAASQQLLTKTQAASAAMRDCLQKSADTEEAASLSNGKPADCTSERTRLTQSFEEAYVALTREVATYKELVADKSCADTVENDYGLRIGEQRQTEKELSSQVAAAMSRANMLRPELATLRSTQKELATRLEALSLECASLRRTKKSLVDTERVINEMEGCADLDASAFKLPVWVGKWITAELDEDQPIHKVDAAMNDACAKSFGARARAAEVSEIDTGSIVKMPKYNCAMAPFLPACPLCGTDLARVCWDSGARLDHYERRVDCSPGTRAILCVSDSDE